MGTSLDWLKQQLIQAKDKPKFLFLHHPLFDIGVPYVDTICLQDVEEFAALIKYLQNIRHVFYGHVLKMTCVNWRGVPFTSVLSLNH